MTVKKIFNKKVAMIIILLLIVVTSLWAYSISYAAIEIKPDKQQIISSNKPTISVDWPFAVGAKLKQAKVLLDGRDISKDIRMQDRGFVYKTVKKLQEGIHVIDAQLEYDIVFKKKVFLKWFFSTDTVSPRIDLNERNNTLASRTPKLGLKGITEPLSKLKIRFNNKSVRSISSNKSGTFKVNLKGLAEKNNLLLTAIDRAGNMTKRKLKVIIDNKPPEIKKINTGKGKVLFSANKDDFKIALTDADSGISKVDLNINGHQAKTKYDKKKDVLYYGDEFVKDGRYTASLNVFDVAGNKLSKKWRFRVDTGKVVIDQSDFKLSYYKGDKIVHTVSIAVGKARFPTPNGLWKVVRKKKMPSWYNPRKGWSKSMPPVIPPGARNPLGLRALYLDASGIRVHGTSAYRSIGRRASHGCIRVRNKDIVGLYPKVGVGTPVTIKP